MEIKTFYYQDFYDFYNKIEDPKIKKLLQKQMIQKCRVTGETIRNWISQKSIPFYQSNRVTKVVNNIASLLELSDIITEKMLFPNYSLEIEMYGPDSHY